MPVKNNKTKSIRAMSNKKIALLAVAVFLFSAVVSIVVTANSGNNTAANFIKGAFIADGEVMDGTLEIEGVEPIDDVPEGEVRYFINKNVVFQNTYTRGDIILQNPEKCGYILEFKFYLADGSSNKPIYTSEKLEPGQYISEDKLDRAIKSGKNDCTYTVTAYSLDDPEKAEGELSGFLTITVVS